MLVFLDVYSTNVKFIKKDGVDIILKNLKTMITDDHQYNKLVYYNLFGYNFPEDVDLIDNFLTSSICDTIICSCNIKIIVDVVNMRTCSTFIKVANGRVFSWRDVNTKYHPTMYAVLYKYRYHTTPTLVGLVSSK